MSGGDGESSLVGVERNVGGEEYHTTLDGTRDKHHLPVLNSLFNLSKMQRLPNIISYHSNKQVNNIM